MKRREFVAKCGQVALGLSAGLSLAGCLSGRRTSPGMGPGDPWQSRIRELESGMPQLMAEHRIPGLSLALIRDARVVWRRGFGVRDRNSGEPVDHDTIFQAASMSKPVFAYRVLRLCEQGVLNLDTPLVRYAPERLLEGDPRVDQITVRHVLAHTSGFQDFRSEKEPLRIHFTPGEKFLYSGEGYYWLQSVVNRLTGGRVDPTDCAEFEAGLRVCATDFDAQMQRNVLRPFGMASSGYVATDAIERRTAKPHDGEGRPMRYNRPSAAAVARYGAVGGLLTTPTEYARFMIELMDPKPADGFRLTQASVAEMLRPQVTLETTAEQTISWGLGWKLAHTQQGDLVEHSGENPGFVCFNQWSPARKSGYVVMTNALNGGIFQKLVPDLARWVTGAG